MPILSDLTTKMGDYLGTDATRFPVSVREDFVNQVQREVLRDNDLRFGETAVTINTIVGTTVYALPARFSRPLYAYYASSTGARVDLLMISPELYTQKYALATASGGPSHFAILGSSIFLGPIPDAVYGISLTYYQLLADLASGGSNDFSNQAWEVLLYGALVKASKYIVEDARVEVWREEYRGALDALIREHKLSQTAARRPISSEPH